MTSAPRRPENQQNIGQDQGDVDFDGAFFLNEMVVLKQEKRLKSTYGSPATQIQEPWPSRTMAQDGSSGLNAPCTFRCQTWMEILHFYR